MTISYKIISKVIEHQHINNPTTINIKQIPKMISKRLSNLSSNKAAFEYVREEYQSALNKSHYSTSIQYTEAPDDKNNKKTTRKRRRKIIYFQPPFCLSVKTKVGRSFLNLVKKAFHPDQQTIQDFK